MKYKLVLLSILTALISCNHMVKSENKSNTKNVLNTNELELKQIELGLGLVSINISDKTTLDFYDTSNDKEPKRTIGFFNDSSINCLNIREIDKHKDWLKPEILMIDYYQLVFRCVAVQDNWFKVMVNNETEETLWLKKSDLTTFSDWENYLKEMFGVARLSDQQQKIRSLPTDNSEEIIYHGQDCFQVKSMKGDWIEIFTADYCDESYTKSKTKIKSGWIKWRQGNKLLIEYYTRA